MKQSDELKDGKFEKKKQTHEEKFTCSGNLRDYLLNTTIHGLRYVGTATHTWIERAFFTLAFFLVTFLAAYFISNVWVKWSGTPVIIGLNPKLTSLKEFPFPAITICNMNQAKKSEVEHYTEDSVEYSLLGSLCSRSDKFVRPKRNITGRWTLFKGFLMKSSQPCSELLVMCQFGGIEENCVDVFRNILTDEGLCCTFNNADPSIMFKSKNFNYKFLSDTEIQSNNWTPEKGYSYPVDMNTYPRMPRGSGSSMGLTLVLNANVSEYFCSSTSSSGFKVLFHSPMESPKIDKYGFLVATGNELRVEIVPKIDNASPSIKSIDQKMRQCVFSDEVNLSYFGVYTQKNCEMECEAKLIEENCGCVLYYMPKPHNDTEICSRADSICYEKIMYEVEITTDANLSCNCLPACFEIHYSREVSNAKLSDGSYSTSEYIFAERGPEFIENNIAVLHMFFRENSIRSYTKNEFIGFTEFLSNTGGLLGLFLGFSVISLIEVIYFLTLRPYFILKQQQEARDSSKVVPYNDVQPRQARGSQSSLNEAFENRARRGHYWIRNSDAPPSYPYIE